MFNKKDKNVDRKARHLRVRKTVFGTAARPRLCVYRSLNNIYCQIINDETGHTLVSASTLDKQIAAECKNASGREQAAIVGKYIAVRALEKNIKAVVFDRGGYIYTGRVKELADAARENGLEF